MPPNRLILCHPLLFLPSIFPSIRVFSSESALCIRWPKFWSFHFNISPSNEYSGLHWWFSTWGSAQQWKMFSIPGSSTLSASICMFSHVWLCKPMDCSPPVSSVHRILQARILEWVAMLSSRGSSQPRDQTHLLCLLALASRFFTTEPPGKPLSVWPQQSVGINHKHAPKCSDNPIPLCSSPSKNYDVCYSSPGPSWQSSQFFGRGF